MAGRRQTSQRVDATPGVERGVVSVQTGTPPRHRADRACAASTDAGQAAGRAQSRRNRPAHEACQGTMWLIVGLLIENYEVEHFPEVNDRFPL